MLRVSSFASAFSHSGPGSVLAVERLVYCKPLRLFDKRVRLVPPAPVLHPGCNIRLAPDTYCRFDGSQEVTLQSAFCDQALRIKFDILLILYELIQWKDYQSLIDPWPEPDQVKIKQYLQMFYDAQMLQVQGVNDTAALTPGSPEDLDANSERLRRSFNKVPINVENHLNMLKDNVRMAAYRRAIERLIKPGDVVLDLGSGSGVLSFFASRAGARQVIGIERQAHVADLAEALAQRNGIDNVTVHRALSTQLQPEQLGPVQPNVLVSEIIGDGILEENVLEYTLDARRRLLAPGAKLLPQSLDIYGFAFYVDAPRHTQQEVAELTDLYGLDFGLLGDVLASKASLRRERYHPQLYTPMSDPVRLHRIDFATIEETTFHVPIRMPIRHGGRVSGICLYFKAWLDEETVLTNSPWSASTHWSQLMYYLADPETFATGQTFEAELIYDGALRVSLL
jgi:precorrin-6B methylase 2